MPDRIAFTDENTKKKHSAPGYLGTFFYPEIYRDPR